MNPMKYLIKCVKWHDITHTHVPLLHVEPQNGLLQSQVECVHKSVHDPRPLHGSGTQLSVHPQLPLTLAEAFQLVASQLGVNQSEFTRMSRMQPTKPSSLSRAFSAAEPKYITAAESSTGRIVEQFEQSS